MRRIRKGDGGVVGGRRKDRKRGQLFRRSIDLSGLIFARDIRLRYELSNSPDKYVMGAGGR